MSALRWSVPDDAMRQLMHTTYGDSVQQLQDAARDVVALARREGELPREVGGATVRFRNAIRDLALQIPAGDPAGIRLELLLTGLVQELDRLGDGMRKLADEVLEDRKNMSWRIADERERARPDGSVPGSSRTPAVTGDDAGL